jgi:proteasome lid subunit RPN8/RPN11
MDSAIASRYRGNLASAAGDGILCGVYFKSHADEHTMNVCLKTMEIHLSYEAADSIRKHAESGFPREVCGFLLGQGNAQGRRSAIEILPARNAAGAAQSERRYRISPECFLRAERYAREQALDLVGCYHSHPGGPACPSQDDAEQAIWPGFSYLIVTSGTEAPEWRSFSLSSDRKSLREEVIVLPGNGNYSEGV